MWDSVTAWVLQPCKQQQPPTPRPCTHPTPPIPLIHKLTSPNRPPLPVTKITIFKIHSRAFAYTHCADWDLKGDMQNAVCGGNRAMQLAGFYNHHPLLNTTEPVSCPPRCKCARRCPEPPEVRTLESSTVCRATRRPREGQGFACSYIVKL